MGANVTPVIPGGQCLSFCDLDVVDDDDDDDVFHVIKHEHRFIIIIMNINEDNARNRQTDVIRQNL